MTMGTSREAKEGEYKVGVTAKIERQDSIYYAGLHFLMVSHIKYAPRFLLVLR